MGQLTELQIKNAEHREKEYFLADGDGLYLRVRLTRKVWMYRYKRDGKEIKLGLGRYPRCFACGCSPKGSRGNGAASGRN